MAQPVGNHPGIQVHAPGMADRQDPLIVISSFRFACDGARADLVCQGQSCLLTATRHSPVDFAQLPTLRRINAVQTYPGAANVESITIDDEGAADDGIAACCNADLRRLGLEDHGCRQADHHKPGQTQRFKHPAVLTPHLWPVQPHALKWHNAAQCPLLSHCEWPTAGTVDEMSLLEDNAPLPSAYINRARVDRRDSTKRATSTG